MTYRVMTEAEMARMDAAWDDWEDEREAVRKRFTWVGDKRIPWQGRPRVWLGDLTPEQRRRYGV